MGNDHYKDLWRQLEGKGIVPFDMEPPPEDNLPPLEEPSDDDDVLMPFGMAKPKAEKKRKVHTPSTGAGGSSGSGGPPPLPPPAIPPTTLVEPPPIDPVPPPPVPEPEPPPVVAPPEEDILVPMEHVVEESNVRRSARRGVGWQDSFNGLRIRYDPDYTVPATGVHFTPNWQIQCPNPDHKRCFKKRHVNDAHTAACGEVEPVSFLHVWTETPRAPGKSHSKTDPDQDAVVAFANAHREELLEVVGRCIG